MVFFSATALPLVVVITDIGVRSPNMLAQNAAALVATGTLSVIIFPTLAFAILRRSAPGAPGPAGDVAMAEVEPEGRGEW